MYRIIVSKAIPLILISFFSYLVRIKVIDYAIGSIVTFLYSENYLLTGVLPMACVFVGLYFINRALIKGAELR